MKTRKRGVASLLAAVMILALALSGCGQTETPEESPAAQTETSTDFAGGIGKAEDPYQIATAEQLGMVRDNLGACYVLTADIDLSGVENWEPIGVGVPDASDPSGEVPSEADAFHGTFDGNGKIISGLTVSQDLAAESMGAGLFGAAANATIKNLTLKDAAVTGNVMTAAAVGYSYSSTIENVDLTGENTITGVVNNGAATGNAPNMMAGIAGAGMDSTFTGCDVSGLTLAMETLPDAAALTENAHDIGVLGGGLEGCTLSDCTASDSSVTVDGPYCFGVGGLSGCAMSAPSVSGCAASNVTVTVGDNAYLVGGLLGYTGIDSETLTEVSDCKAENVAIVVGDGAERVGGVLGGGFYLEIFASYYPNPTSFSLTNCTASGSIEAPDGKAVGALVGCSYLSPMNGCTGSVTVNGAAADALGEDAALTAVAGTYQGLFAPTTFKSEYDSLWTDYCTAVVGTEAGSDMAAMMKSSIGGSIYGKEAVDAYTANPESTQFCCEFTGGLNKLTFDGMTISGEDESGSALFSHTYEYIGLTAIGADEGISGFEGYAYKSLDENSGEFTYFILMPDTPATTHHLELRYGSDLEELAKYASGDYAYWLAAAFLVDAPESEVEAVIALFCTENMDYCSERSDSSLAAISALVGTWDADLSAYGDAYAGVTLYTTIDESGNGLTYMNGEQTRSYMAFAYDNDGNDATSSGVYVAYDKDAEEAEACKYALTDGGNTWIIYDMAGNEMISYTKR